MDAHELARSEAQVYAKQGQIFRPLAASVTDPDSSPGVPTGLSEIDDVLGGGYRTGLHLLVGFAHNGKTQALLRMIWENRDRMGILFTPDESSEMVINKLLCIATGEHVDDVFWWPAKRKAELVNEFYPLLVVNEDMLQPHEMLQLITEASQVHQQEPAYIAYDYLDMFSGGRGQDALGAIRSKLRKLKGMVKDTHLPWIVLHQLNRGGSKGRPVTMTDLNMGGEQEAITITACWRSFFDPQLPPSRRMWEEQHPTMHVGVIKNKNRPSLLPDGHQYAIDRSGLLRPMGPADRIMTGMRDLA